jgi:hypothetical protein
MFPLRGSLLLVFGLALFFAGIGHAEAATKYWIGSAGGSFSDNANWSTTSGGSNNTTAPGTSDIATFDGGGNTNAAIDTTISVAGIDINSGYTQTITQNNGVKITIGTSAFDISSGTFTGGNDTIDLNGAFTVSGGTFNATSSGMYISGNFTVSSGTFSEGTGTIIGDGGTGFYNVATSETFYNLKVVKTGGQAVSITSGDTLIILNDLTLTDGQINTGTVDVHGDITQASTMDISTATVNFSSADTQTYTMNGGFSPVIRFDAAEDASDSVVLTADASVQGLTVTSSFSGTVPIQYNGHNLTLINNFTQAAGTFTPSATFTLQGASFSKTGGDFVEGTGTIIFTAVGNSIDVATTETFYNLTIAKGGGHQFNLSSADTLVVTNALTLTDGLIPSGTIDVMGNITQASTFDGGAGAVGFASASAQTYTISGGIAPVIKFDEANDASDNVIFGAATTLGGVNITSGFSGTVPFTYNGNNITLTSSFTQAAGTFTPTPTFTLQGASFTKTGGEFVEGTGTVVISSSSSTFDVATSETFYNVTLSKTSGQTFTISSGDTMIVTNTLLLTDGAAQTGTMQAFGSVTVGSLYDGGTATLAFTGSNIQTFGVVGSTGLYNGDITVHKTAGKLTLSGALIMDASSQDLTILEGTMDLNGYTLTVSGTSGTFVVQSGATLKLLGSESITTNTNYPSNQTGSTVLYSGTSGPYTLKNFVYRSLTLSGGSTYNLPASLTVGGHLTIANSTLDATTSNYDLSVAGNWLNNGTFVPRSAEVILNGTNQTMSGSTTFYDLTKSVTTASTLTFIAGSTQTITNAVTINGAISNILSLRSSLTGTQWKINPQGTRAISYVDVKDSNNIHATAIDCFSCTSAGNNINWGIAYIIGIDGTVYTDAGTTTMGAGRIVAVSINGEPRSYTGSTAANGTYSISNVSVVPGDVLMVYLDGATEKAVAVTIGSGDTIPLLDLYRDYLITRCDNSCSLSNANLATAASNGDSDVSAIFTMSSNALTMASGKTLHVATSQTYAPAASVTAHDIDINGTLSMNASTITISGSWDATGGSFTGSNTVTFTSTSNETITSNGSAFSTIVLNGTGGVWSLGDAFEVDEALTIASGILSLNGSSMDLTGASLNNAATVRLQGGETLTGISQDTNSGLWHYVGNGDGIATNFTMTDVGSTDYYNLLFSSTDSGDTFTSAATKVVAGTLTVSRGAYVAATTTVTGQVRVGSGTYNAAQGTQTFNNGLTVGGGSFSGELITVDVNGSLTLTGGTLVSPSVLTVSGDWTKSGGSFVSYGRTVTFDGGSAQTITTGGTDDFSDFSTISIAKSAGTVTLADTLSGSQITITGGTFSPGSIGIVTNGLTLNGGTLTGGTGTIDVNGAVTLSSGTLTAPSGSFTVSGNWTKTSGTFAPGTNTVVFDGTTDQTLTPNNGHFYHLTLQNTGGGTSDELIVTGAPLRLSGALIVTSGSVDLSRNNLNATIQKGITVADNAQAIFISDGDVTASGSISVGAAGSFTMSGQTTLTLNGGVQTLDTNNQPLYNLVVSSSSGTTLSSNQSVTNLLRIATGSSLSTVSYVVYATGASISNFGRLYENGTTGYIKHASSNFLIADASYVEDSDIATGDTAYFTISDGDENLNGQSPDTLTITVGAASGDSETVTLTETGDSSGLFRGSISTANAVANTANSVLSTTTASVITASDEDAQDALTDSDTATFSITATSSSSSSGNSTSSTGGVPGETGTRGGGGRGAGRSGAARAGGKRGHETTMAQKIAQAQERILAHFHESLKSQERTIEYRSDTDRTIVRRPEPAEDPKNEISKRERPRLEQMKREYLFATVDGELVVFRDVPIKAWFAPYVNTLVNAGVAQGYRHENGKPKGLFGVEQAVTYAEALKMSFEASGKDLRSLPPPRNASARGTWAAMYVAAAESENLSIIAPTRNVHTPITRAEFVHLALDILHLPIADQAPQFSDVPKDHPHANALATAQFYGIMKGDTSPDGTLLGTVRPDTFINRVEVAKMIATLKTVLDPAF